MPIPKRRISKQNSPIDAKQRALLDQQRKLLAETQRLEKMVSEAPKRRAEIERRREEQDRLRREEMLQRTSPYFDRFDNDLYRSQRLNAATGKRRQPRTERRAEILRFLALAILAIIVCAWVYVKYFAS